jgi:3-hydroxyacyl-[acyl-carrier-protein] dehydratase
MQFDVTDILSIQKNRFPLLFIDKITECDPGKMAIGVKNYTYNEWFFPPHFEGDPNVPGFVQVESLVQTFLMTFLTLDDLRGCKTNFLKINNASFKKKIVPGDTSIIKAHLKNFKRGIATGSAISYVGDEIACSADFMVAVPSVLDQFKPKS